MRTQAVLLLFTFTSFLVSAQTVVPVYEEPRHHLVFESPEFRILDAQMEPGDTSLFHTHASPSQSVVISISLTDGQIFGEDWAHLIAVIPPEFSPGLLLPCNIAVADNPLTHRVRNVGTNLLRVINISNRGQGVEQPPFAPLGEVKEQCKWFQSSRITLEPENETNWAQSMVPMVAIQVSTGQIELIDRTGVVEKSAALGDFLIQRANQEFQLRNVGTEPVTMVLVQVLR
jgi:hypothetical protein